MDDEEYCYNIKENVLNKLKLLADPACDFE